MKSDIDNTIKFIQQELSKLKELKKQFLNLKTINEKINYWQTVLNEYIDKKNKIEGNK